MLSVSQMLTIDYYTAMFRRCILQMDFRIATTDDIHDVNINNSVRECLRTTGNSLFVTEGINYYVHTKSPPGLRLTNSIHEMDLELSSNDHCHYSGIKKGI